MRYGSSEPGPASPAGASDGEATRTLQGRDLANRPEPDRQAGAPIQAPAETVPPHVPAETAPSYARTDAQPPGRPPEIVRYGPGVPATPPAGQAELTAERAWRASGPGKPAGRRARLGRLLGWALTAILLAAAGVLLYLRFHHAPFRMTGVAITQQTQNGCGVDVTGRITTNGSAGTVSYQWLFRPGPQPPQPLSQSVVAGQDTVYVTVAVEGQGHGTASQTVTLQVLGPQRGAASAAVTVSCP